MTLIHSGGIDHRLVTFIRNSSGDQARERWLLIWRVVLWTDYLHSSGRRFVIVIGNVPTKMDRWHSWNVMDNTGLIIFFFFHDLMRARWRSFFSVKLFTSDSWLVDVLKLVLKLSRCRNSKSQHCVNSLISLMGFPSELLQCCSRAAKLQLRNQGCPLRSRRLYRPSRWWASIVDSEWRFLMDYLHSWMRWSVIIFGNEKNKNGSLSRLERDK